MNGADENEIMRGKRFEKKEKNHNKIGKVIKILIITIIILLIISIVGISIFIGSKIGKINFKDLNEDDLDINEDVYSDVSSLTENEYNEVINILLLGSDSRNMDDTYEGNSDAIMIISINPKYKSIKLISIPRDTAANIEGMDSRYKINYAFNKGKEQLAIKTINKTFGLNLREYVTVNISAMYDIINKLGGLELDITKDEMNYINKYIEMFYDFSGNDVQKVTKYGKVTLTGEQVAAHVKERMAGSNAKTEDHGDYGRTIRQREVITALMNKIASRDISEISQIIDMILSQVTTNIDIAKYTALIPEILSHKSEYLNNITSVMLPGLDYSNEILENGAYLYVTDENRAKKDFIYYMYEI